MTRLRFSEMSVRPQGISPETYWNRRRERELIGGYYYPLDVRRALDSQAGVSYIARAVERARREPDSARNLAEKRARAVRRRATQLQAQRRNYP